MKEDDGPWRDQLPARRSRPAKKPGRPCGHRGVRPLGPEDPSSPFFVSYVFKGSWHRRLIERRSARSIPSSSFIIFKSGSPCNRRVLQARR